MRADIGSMSAAKQPESIAQLRDERDAGLTFASFSGHRNLHGSLTDVARLMRTVFDRRVRRLGLTRAQWLALTRLHRRPGASQSELADMMEVEKATVGRLVDRLEAKGWVERRAQAGDRRVNRLHDVGVHGGERRRVGGAHVELHPAFERNRVD